MSGGCLSGDTIECEISVSAMDSLSSQTVSLLDPTAAMQTPSFPHTQSFFSPPSSRSAFVLYFSRLALQLSLRGRRSMAHSQVRPGTAAAGFTQTPCQLQMWPISGSQVRSVRNNSAKNRRCNFFLHFFFFFFFSIELSHSILEKHVTVDR